MPRRVVAKVEWHPGELYPRVGFIVTNLSRPAERRRLLQRTRHRRAMDQGRQERGEVDAAVVLLVRRQRRAAATPRAGLQPCELPKDAGATGRHREVVVD